MTPLKIFLVLAFVVSCSALKVKAQQPVQASNRHYVQTGQKLSAREQAIVMIAASTAQGNMTQLTKALNTGLDLGLSINEIKEVLVQLYAYTGFPRSLNALNNLMAVLKERKGRGINDQLGKEPSPLPVDKTKLEFGTQMQTRLVGKPVSGEVYQFAPAIDQFLKEHLFGDIFGRDNLDWKTREIATISALAALGGVEAQLRSHFGVGIYNGLTAGQLSHLVSIIKSSVGDKDGNAASQVLQSVLKQRQEVRAPEPGRVDTIFPKGTRVTNYNFTGTAWLHTMVNSDSTFNTTIANVTFEPGARTSWHYHPGGQVLLVTSGRGRYVEKGKPVRELRKGDVIKCAPNIIHWHGAAPDSEMSHIAVGTNAGKGAVVWLHPVSDEEYNKIN